MVDVVVQGMVTILNVVFGVVVEVKCVVEDVVSDNWELVSPVVLVSRVVSSTIIVDIKVEPEI